MFFCVRVRVRFLFFVYYVLYIATSSSCIMCHTLFHLRASCVVYHGKQYRVELHLTIFTMNGTLCWMEGWRDGGMEGWGDGGMEG